MLNVETNQQPDQMVSDPGWRKEGKDYVLHAARNHDVKLVDLWFVDVSGCLRSLIIPVEDLDKTIAEGVSLDGASLLGPGGIGGNRVTALPDPDTFRVLPWKGHSGSARARMFCDTFAEDGSPFEGDPRYILKKNLKRAAEIDYVYYVGLSLECAPLAYSEAVESRSLAGINGSFASSMRNFRRELMISLDAMGVDVRYLVCGGAADRQAIELSYTDALTMADNLMTCRLAVKHTALRNHLVAGFMGGWSAETNGARVYLHQSLFRKGRNAFYDADDGYHMSGVARSYVGSLLKHVPEIMSVTGRWIVCGDGLPSGQAPPLHLPCQRPENPALIRVLGRRPGKEKATRIEVRYLDAGYNPYLVFSVMLAAGLDGIEKGYELSAGGTESTGEVFEKEGDGNESRLPPSLGEAIESTERSELVRRALGRTLFGAFISARKKEWERSRTGAADTGLSSLDASPVDSGELPGEVSGIWPALIAQY